MPSQPQATLQATNVPMKLFQPERNYTQNVRKIRLLICDGIACNKAGSLTSLGSISAHICVRSIIALRQVRHCFREHQLCLHTCAHCSWLAGAEPSLNIFFSFLHLTETHQLVSSCGSFYLAIILPTYAEHQDKQPTVICCICVFVAHFPHGPPRISSFLEYNYTIFCVHNFLCLKHLSC